MVAHTSLYFTSGRYTVVVAFSNGSFRLKFHKWPYQISAIFFQLINSTHLGIKFVLMMKLILQRH